MKNDKIQNKQNKKLKNMAEIERGSLVVQEIVNAFLLNVLKAHLLNI